MGRGRVFAGYSVALPLGKIMGKTPVPLHRKPIPSHDPAAVVLLYREPNRAGHGVLSGGTVRHQPAGLQKPV